ncbi:MAG: glycosyltransferase family 4 protein [Desulfarculaceae bacterium]|nr:glycosyltransferase family 4 protein [Desulfarculaceae bacterium]MCF8071402.1 glycosyltransferase family 4 protein [Desulfarculaceae bacterium]MCF8101727.1 glycosyltransferase family 4 protein [Desulfarculaceae bacterium]MCF8117990.1 glycosyltransferase family 4 protein [Desulfarculaceae bacterium]
MAAPDQNGRLRATLVMPWYGEQVPGGAEAEARHTAENLVRAGVQVQVLTTCLAGLGSDWDHASLPAGLSEENGVMVRRFPVASRDGGRFDGLNLRVVAGGLLSPKEERDFFRNMVYSPKLLEHIAAHPEEGPFFYIPYLFTSSVWGPLLHPSKSMLIPCLHDEGYARLSAVKKAFESCRAVCFHVPAERDLAAGLYDLKQTEPLIVGEGMDTDWSADAERFRADFGLEDPFILYAGRKDPGKNTPLLINYFLQYKRERRGPKGLKLVLIGNLPAEIPPEGREHVIDLGFVTVQQKYDAYAASEVFVQPSIMESFSRVIMEAWLAGTPVMVHQNCAVTREHVLVSGGGLPFGDYLHFAEDLDYLFARPQLRQDMARAGRDYVLANFSWPVVTANYLRLIEQVCAEPPSAPTTMARVLSPSRRPLSDAPAVHQMVPDFSFGDAIGNEALAMQKLLRSWGLTSDIFAYAVHPRLADRARPAEEYFKEGRPQDLLLFHFSTGHPLADRLPKMPGRRLLRYHNITPARFLEDCNPEGAERARQGREQLSRVAQAVELGIGVSDYNCLELSEAGCPDTVTVPIMLDLSLLSVQPDEFVNYLYGDGRPAVLHVGRLAPNKAIQDLIKTQYWLSRLVPGVRLLLVGSEAGCESYAQGLRELARRLVVPDVHFSGHISLAGLMGYYRLASCYLCLSEHEGFCVPLVESMHMGIPIVAYAEAGVPGTLGGAGLLLEHKEPEYVAEAVAKVLTDPDLAESMRAAGKARLERFSPERVAQDLREVLTGRLGLELPA